MSERGVIFSIQRYSLHDGPGIRTTVFLKGCPLRCVWCHNPESKRKETELLFNTERCVSCGRCMEVCSAGARLSVYGQICLDREKCTACGKCLTVCPTPANEIKGEDVDVEFVIGEVEKDHIFYDTSGGGMTLSGGEPAMQKDFSLALLRAAKEAGIGIAVETSGASDPEFYKEAAALGTLFLYDIKALDDAKHREYVGASNSLILSNLEFLFSLGAKVVLRLPLVPGYNDSDADLAMLKEYLSSHKGKFQYADIMPYHNLGTSKEKRLGLEPLVIERGEIFTDKWLEALSGDGYEIRVSSE